MISTPDNPAESNLFVRLKTRLQEQWSRCLFRFHCRMQVAARMNELVSLPAVAGGKRQLVPGEAVQVGARP
jgi:hypothetical protein